MITQSINFDSEVIDFQEDAKRYPEFVKLLSDKAFCAQLWTAFANIDWYKKFDPLDSVAEQVADVLLNDTTTRQWSASFRGMGGVIAKLRNDLFGTEEGYMDWYCSNGGIPYGYVSDTVRTSLNAIGWFPVENEYYKKSNP